MEYVFFQYLAQLQYRTRPQQFRTAAIVPIVRNKLSPCSALRCLLCFWAPPTHQHLRVQQGGWLSLGNVERCKLGGCNNTCGGLVDPPGLCMACWCRQSVRIQWLVAA